MVVKGRIYNFLINMIVIVSLLLAACVTVDYATNETTISNMDQSDSVVLNDSNVINGTYFIGVEKEDKITKVNKTVTLKPKSPIIGMYAKPSCGCRYSYTWHYREYVNYCPNCHHYGTLRKNPKGVPEREYTCARCSSDFCGCCGKEKYSWSKVYLRRA